MHLTVNGRLTEVPPDTTLRGLLSQLALTAGSVVVELNGTALRPSEQAATLLREGDRLELVRAVAGG